MVSWLESYLYNGFLPVKISSWGILLLLTFSALLFLRIFISRVSKAREYQLQTKYSKIFEDQLTEFIFDEERYAEGSPDHLELIKSLRRQIKVKLRRRVFGKAILLFHRDFKGIPEQRLEKLYRDIGMSKYAIGDLREGSWYEKAFIFTELGQMNIAEALPIVLKYTNHYNSVLREEAQFAAVRMGGAVNISFMADLELPVSGWQQTRIMQELDRVDLAQIPPFFYLLDAKNASVVAFGLKLLAKYRQVDDPEKIMAKIHDEQEEVRLAALFCIRETEMYSAANRLIERYPKETPEVQQEILNTLGFIGDEEVIQFLEDFLYEDTYNIAYPATRSLVRLGFKLSPDSGIPSFNKELYKHTRYELFPG